MLRRTAGFLVLPALLLLLSSCQKIDAPVTGTFPKESLLGSTTIPGDWGNLVGVSNSTLYPDLMQLSFQDSGGTVRVVVYSLPRNELLNAIVIRRR